MGLYVWVCEDSISLTFLKWGQVSQYFLSSGAWNWQMETVPLGENVCIRVLWCSGYHVCFTRRRPRVRTSPEPRYILAPVCQTISGIVDR